MSSHEEFMRRCIGLARKGEGLVAPNPMVGCVILYKGVTAGEGWHEQFGGPHAEVNAIHNVQNADYLRDATLYVNLEPCAHFGKTPPCADLIIEKKVPRVVIGCSDPNPLVKGQGIEKLRKAGIEVITGVLEEECRELNSAFIRFHEKQRPEIILKWAQTEDGFIDHDRNVHGNSPAKISHPELDKWVHELRASVDAILVGTGTALADNPQLTVRLAEGKNPLRAALDKDLRLPQTLHLFDGSTPTLIFTAKDADSKKNLEYVKIDFSGDVLQQILFTLYKRNARKLLVEGGAKLLTNFIGRNLWDEAYVLKGGTVFGSGVPAPAFDISKPVSVSGPGLYFFRNV
ncbi:MAG: diaminohydroxyphosphoribosylaminopyrimidine deaminase / 5-amino-6-(5-phosphoribosylamino)uracil reductase [Bacteroidetes bacterium]|nr:MAG: diaminohydroxyphosphoribosylaminopyrimidine deaminase / 5-amino-6-(5-phosphoribosylamino)uracil reductase [Bacteroidota bacterium]